MGILLRMFRLLLCLFFLSLTLINSSTKQGKTYLIETGGKGKAWRKSKGDSKFHSRHTRGKDGRNALADFPQAKWHDYSSISGEEKGCKTTKGLNCSFPFKFRGYNYTVCTNDWMNKTKHWCAIETDTNRSVVTWGYCEDSCKKESTGRYYEVKSVADFPHPTQPSEREGHDSGSISGEGKGCKTTKGVNCSFPFKFRGYSYTVCTNDWMNKTKHWCAIETDTNRSLVTWGYCEDSCKKESTGRYYEVKSVADFPHPTQPSERE